MKTSVHLKWSADGTQCSLGELSDLYSETVLHTIERLMSSTTLSTALEIVKVLLNSRLVQWGVVVRLGLSAVPPEWCVCVCVRGGALNTHCPHRTYKTCTLEIDKHNNNRSHYSLSPLPRHKNSLYEWFYHKSSQHSITSLSLFPSGCYTRGSVYTITIITSPLCVSCGSLDWDTSWGKGHKGQIRCPLWGFRRTPGCTLNLELLQTK